VFKGTLDGSRVCIKRVRVYTDDDPKKAAKVRRLTLFNCFPSVSQIRLADLLPRGRDVEIPDTSEHLTPLGCHYHTVPTRFKLDARRGSAGVH